VLSQVDKYSPGASSMSKNEPTYEELAKRVKELEEAETK
jgi:hypothetical protein